MMKPYLRSMACFFWAALLLLGSAAESPAARTRQVTDAAGRTVTVPARIERIICSGAGALRLASYLHAQDLVVAADDRESRVQQYDARPYALANPGYQKLPVFGGFRGFDQPEKILGLAPQPQVIVKTYPGCGHDPAELEAKTGIPVIILEYGDLHQNRDKLYSALTILGQALGREERAAAVIAFFEAQIADLKRRTRNLPDNARPSCFIGGLAFRGPHGFRSTEPNYPPFQFVRAANIAASPAAARLSHSFFSREKLLLADPQILFLDLSTLQMGEGQGGLHELKTDPVYRSLTAVRTGKVFALLPYNWYTQNYGSILANAWYIGKVLYPQRFRDIDPAAQADRIYTFLVGAAVFEQMNETFRQMAFKPVELD